MHRPSLTVGLLPRTFTSSTFVLLTRMYYYASKIALTQTQEESPNARQNHLPLQHQIAAW